MTGSQSIVGHTPFTPTLIRVVQWEDTGVVRENLCRHVEKIQIACTKAVSLIWETARVILLKIIMQY